MLTHEAYEPALRRLKKVLAEAEEKGETLLFKRDLSPFICWQVLAEIQER